MSTLKAEITKTIGAATSHEGGAATAVYKQIEADMRSRIAEGQWAVGEVLPARRELARYYGVSPLTVERAVTSLISDGLLRTDGRRGTFVAQVTPPASPSRLASVGRTGSAASATIGIVGRLFIGAEDHLHLNNQNVRLLVHSIESACAQDRNVTRFINQVSFPNGKAVSLPEAVAEACRSEVDALALVGMGIDPSEIAAAVDIHSRMGGNRPMVVMSTIGRIGRPVAQVYYDNWAAGYEAASHLIETGCQSILAFAPVTAAWSRERIAGATDAAAAFGIEQFVVWPKDPETWQQDVDPVSLGLAQARKLFDGSERPVLDGVFCIQDQGGYGFMQAASEVGLAAGVDYAIMGFDDAEQSRFLNLSSMRAPFERMGVEAVKLLRMSLAGEPANHQMRLRWQLIARTSTAKRQRDLTI